MLQRAKEMLVGILNHKIEVLGVLTHSLHLDFCLVIIRNISKPENMVETLGEAVSPFLS